MIRVRIEVEFDRASGGYPTRLDWQYTGPGGDNMKLYGDDVQRAIKAACNEAIDGAESFVVYRQPTT